ncbi:MAG: type II toxin-antitoxin system prevent-host-death family antitoxin [Pseudolysinimonas sp.]|uniref:type II toxin-antitoxin system Phd/YefM family antitoxin n=1 Tax=Pseudolysinimonas sp. TaxID=2680009 RepID=UPI003C75DE4F
MKTITVGQLRQNPTVMLDEVEAGEVYRITRHDREIARVVPRDPSSVLLPRKRAGGSHLAGIDRHELQSAGSIDQLLADERDR